MKLQDLHKNKSAALTTCFSLKCTLLLPLCYITMQVYCALLQAPVVGCASLCDLSPGLMDESSKCKWSHGKLTSASIFQAATQGHAGLEQQTRGDRQGAAGLLFCSHWEAFFNRRRKRMSAWWNVILGRFARRHETQDQKSVTAVCWLKTEFLTH